MTLARKTLLYSVAIALVVGLVFVAYITLLLPSMYMADKTERIRADARRAHLQFVETGDYTGGENDVMASSFGLLMREGEEALYLSSAFLTGRLTIESQALRALLERFAKLTERALSGEVEDFAALERDFQALGDALSREFEALGTDVFGPVTLDVEPRDLSGETFRSQPAKLHRLGERGMLFEMNTENRLTQSAYTIYFGATHRDGALYFSLLTNVSPSATDILPTMVGAIPVILPLILLLAFGLAELYARSIVKPIVRLARDADRRRQSETGVRRPIEVVGKDEIAELAKSLNLLYRQQEETLAQLRAEGERKELFLKASSHSLKTPIAAASLLSEGMISKVGKYADRERYLPELKAQLRQMQRLVDEILSLDRLSGELHYQRVELRAFALSCLANHRIAAERKGLSLRVSGAAEWVTDEAILGKILDNLLLNAVQYSAAGGEIVLTISAEHIALENRPAAIEAELLPRLFEPFVSGAAEEAGHGLGLYMVRYFSELLNLKVEVSKKGDGVVFTLSRERK